jgi:hypothetical protein
VNFCSLLSRVCWIIRALQVSAGRTESLSSKSESREAGVAVTEKTQNLGDFNTLTVVEG